MSPNHLSRHHLLVIVINDRFLSTHSQVPHPYGVTGFITSFLEQLIARQSNFGLILYKRSPDIQTPYLETTNWRGRPAVRLHFDFNNRESELKELFKRGVHSLFLEELSFREITIYHQTPTLVSLTPPEIPFIVTHHGPFVCEVTSLFGEDFASCAFGGSDSKTTHLARKQKEGLEFLIERSDGKALEMSYVQQHALQKFGVPEERITVCPPSINIPVPPQIGKATASAINITLYSAAARIDLFKQFSTLIEAANELFDDGLPVKVLLHAGSELDGIARHALFEKVLPSLNERCTFLTSLPHRQLLKHFSEIREDNIFVFCSAYETFGLTPLEAALSGVTTIVPDRPLQIGVSPFIPADYKYSGSSHNLAKLLKNIVLSRQLAEFGYEEMISIRATLSRTNFVDTLFTLIKGDVSRDQCERIELDMQSVNSKP